MTSTFKDLNMSNPKRKEISLREKLDLDRLCYVSIDNAIDYLCELRDKSNSEAIIDLEADESYGSFYVTGELSWRRMETDEEYEKRCKEHHKRVAAARKGAKVKKERLEKEERELLAKLKKKYEG